MIFEQFEDKSLSQYSYAVGCAGAGSVAIVDPNRNVDTYLEYAGAQGVKITHVLETHIHADFASGARELAERAGAELLLSAHDEGELYEVGFDHRPIEDGERQELGSVSIQARHTPGHTPEHLSFLVRDGARSAEIPMLMLSGDFLFVGSLGRPDLLGEEAKQQLAEHQFDSVRNKLSGLPDGMEIYPAHGAGSMCGSGMSGRALSTLGYERIANPYLDPTLTREQFVDRILSTVPLFPDYYRRMKELNSKGPTPLSRLPELHALEPETFRERMKAGHVVVDLRSVERIGAGHIPGSFGIGAGDLLSQWAAWVVPYETPILLVAPDERTVRESVRALQRVGLDDVRGYLQGGMEAWQRAGFPVARTQLTTCRDLHRQLADGTDIRVLDVRSDGEWNSGHIEGATHIMAGVLEKNLERVPGGGSCLAVICGSGYRSTVAVSVLERAGVGDLVNVIGGMNAWNGAGLPAVR